MGAAWIQEEMQGDHTFPDWQRKMEVCGGVHGHGRRAWAARRLGKSLGRSSLESEGGQVVGVHQAWQKRW